MAAKRPEVSAESGPQRLAELDGFGELHVRPALLEEPRRQRDDQQADPGQGKEDAPRSGRVLCDREQDEAETVAHGAKQRIDAEAEGAQRRGEFLGEDDDGEAGHRDDGDPSDGLRHREPDRSGGERGEQVADRQEGNGDQQRARGGLGGRR